MAKKFTEEELEDYLELIRSNFYDSDEFMDQTEKYVKRLYRAIPLEKRQALKSEQRKIKVKVSESQLLQSLTSVLSDIYLEEEIRDDVDRLIGELKIHGESNSAGEIILPFGVFVTHFEDQFNPSLFTDDIQEKLLDIRSKVLESWRNLEDA